MSINKFHCMWEPADTVEVYEIGKHIHLCTNTKNASDVVLIEEELVNFSTHMMTLAMLQMDPADMQAFGNMMVETAQRQLLPASVLPDEVVKPEPARQLSNLSPQAQLIYRHMQRAGSISARDAMDDHGITSAALSRRICDIEAEGFGIDRERRIHPITEKSYTRYTLKGAN